MLIILRHNIILIVLSAIVSFAIFLSGTEIVHAQGFIATTTVTISVCGDGVVDGSEICDDGSANNDGAYGPSIAGRRCLPGCDGYGPYCGDVIIQFLHSEECDDGNNSSGGNDLCSPICLHEESPINTTNPGGESGSGGGAGGAVTGVIPITNPTRVIISGKAYPSSIVHLLKDGKALATTPANGFADFTYETDDITPGPATFGFWAEDGKGNRSITFTTTFQVTQNAVTTVSGVFIPPTINIDKTAVRQGENIFFSGQTIPNADILMSIDGEEELSQDIQSEGSGFWEFDFDTMALENEAFHTAKTAFVYDDDDGKLHSGFSQSISFYVGEKDVEDIAYPDLNIDGSVNIVDFSILLFHWGGDGGGSNPSVDINHDGTVNLTDFSIMIFHWTG